MRWRFWPQVVGNPCNTNALIALANAPSLNPRNFHALTRLDEVCLHPMTEWASEVRVSVQLVDYIMCCCPHLCRVSAAEWTEPCSPLLIVELTLTGARLRSRIVPSVSWH